MNEGVWLQCARKILYLVAYSGGRTKIQPLHYTLYEKNGFNNKIYYIHNYNIIIIIII
jgi:hypothetical protein